MAISPPPPVSDARFDDWFLRFYKDTVGGTVSTTTATVDASTLNHAQLGNLDSANFAHLTGQQRSSLTGGGDSSLHFHAADRSRQNHLGTQTAETISDFAAAAQASVFGSIVRAQGAVPFFGVGGQLAVDSSNFFWDDANNRLGVGNASPSYALDVTGSINASSQLRSAVATGTAPLVVASTTKVSNLNADLLDGADWASPAALGSSTPAAVTGTTINATTKYQQGGSDILYENANRSLALGFGAGTQIIASTIADSVALGYHALNSASLTGGTNTAVGAFALERQTTGTQNVAFGYGALGVSTVASNNLAMGYNALANCIRSENNVAIGTIALVSHNLASQTYGGNVAIGAQCQASNTTGTFNTAIGNDCMRFITSARFNVGIGASALNQNSTTECNTAIGAFASSTNQAASQTIAIGYSAGGGNGSNHVGATGYTFIGYQAGQVIQAGADYNTAIGYQQGYGITTGKRNVLIGVSTVTGSMNQVTSGQRNIAIGNDVALVSATGNDQLNIGNIFYGVSIDGTDTTVSTGRVSLGTTADNGTDRWQVRGGSAVVTANGGYWARRDISESITLSTSGATTDSTANLLPANSIIEAVVARVTTTITTATDWKLGDATTADRFTAANSTMTAGTTDIGLRHQQGGVATDAAGPVQTAAAKLRITLTGTPGAGVIRVTVFYRTFVAPTS